MEILHFVNLEPISTTSWGAVYRARDPLLDRTVALKVIHPQNPDSDLPNLLAEARAAAAIDHPNICTIHQVHQVDDGSVVMEINWCPGGSLNNLLDDGQLNGESTLEMARGIASGLLAIHEGGLLHRDIKPGNILIDKHGQPRLADFGLSAPLLGDGESQTLMAGTMPYMAPELFHGEDPSVATDIWALGVVYYQMVAGQLPFSDMYEAALKYSIEFSDVPEISPDHPPAQRIIQAALLCLKKDPGERPASAASVLELLEEPVADTRPSRPSTPSPKWPGFAAGMALMVFLVLFFTGTLPGLSPDIEGKKITASGVTVLPFTSVGGDKNDAAMARGLSQNTTDALLQLEHEMEDWWFVPPRRIHLRAIDNLTRSHGLTGATYAITGRLEKLSDDLYQLSLRKEHIGAGLPDNDLEFVVELTARHNDLTTWQVEIPRRIVHLLKAPWPKNAEAILRAGGTSAPNAFNYYLQGRGILAASIDAPDTTAARLAFANAIEADPNYALGWWGLGLTDEKRGGPGSRDQARQKWQQSLSLEPDLELSLAALGWSYHWSENDSTAQHYLARLTDAHPGDFRAHLALGDVYAGLGDSVAAHSSFIKAMELHPGDAVGPNCLGAFFFNSYGNTEAAAHSFNQAAGEAANDPETFLFLGACHFANDQLAKSQRAFEHSLSLEHNDLALEYLAIIYFYQGSFGRGATLAKELLQQNDSRYEVWNLLGVCQEQIPEQRHLARGSYEKAAELCRAEINRTDDLPSLWAMMGLIEAELGNRPEARQWLNRAAARGQLTGDSMINLADGFETLGDRNSALYWLEKLFATGYSSVAVERHPGFADLRSDSRYREFQ